MPKPLDYSFEYVTTAPSRYWARTFPAGEEPSGPKDGDVPANTNVWLNHEILIAPNYTNAYYPQIDRIVTMDGGNLRSVGERSHSQKR